MSHPIALHPALAHEGEARDSRWADRANAELIAAILAKDSLAVAAFYDRYAAEVRRILARLLGATAELADAHHEAFVRALSSLEKLRDPEKLSQWMTSVAILTARSVLQRRARRWWLRFVPSEELPEPDPVVPDTDGTEALRAIYGILRTLPPDEQIAFSLRFIEGMELTEVADGCDVSLATIKRRLARAEARFTAAAEKHPVLEPWLKGGTRWGERTR